jgi:phosphoribosylformimino-5-aminoimidazole carboxamide ribotide isomerase
MLIIPALHIHEGRCIRTADGEPGTRGQYPVDPVQVARLWRGENAKALHVVALDDEGAGLRAAFDVLSAIADAVDIPVQFSAGLTDADEVARAFDDAGVSRVVLPATKLRGGEFLALLLERFGPRRIVVEAAVDVAEIISQGDGSEESEGWIARATQWKHAGLQRVVVRDASAGASLQDEFVAFLLSLAERTNLSVTLNGSVREYKDLTLLQNVHPRKIDSIILDEALYSNAFPCQKIWRIAEQQLLAQHKLL